MSSTHTHEYENLLGKLPVLNKANARQWFNQAQITLEARDIEHVLTTTKEIYAFDYGPEINPDKERAFKKNNANTRLILLKGLDEFAKKDVEEMRTCKTIWEHLQVKYKNKRLAIGLAILRDLTNYTFDERISNAWNDINNKRRHLKEINSEVIKVFSENQIFQILLNSLSKAYTSLADDLITSHDAINEKLQKLMNKEDTLTQIDFVIAAYRKTFKASCFLCDDGVHLVAQCSYLSKTQAYIKEKVVKTRSTSRNRNRSRKSRRYHHHNSSNFEASITLLESTNSEIEKKKKKSEKKPVKKNKKKRYTYTCVSDLDWDNDNAYKAISDSESESEINDEDIHAYARVMNKIAGSTPLEIVPL